MDIRWIDLDTVDSTSSHAVRLAEDGDMTAPTCIVAREQTAGRGTRGRSWLSPRDAGIYASLIDPRFVGMPPPPGMLARAVGGACCCTLRDCTGLPVTLAGINDLVVDGRKLGGVLVETTIERGATGPIIIGVGINTVNIPRDVGPGGRPPCSLEALMGQEAFARLDVSGVRRDVVEAILCCVAGVMSE